MFVVLLALSISFILTVNKGNLSSSLVSPAIFAVAVPREGVKLIHDDRPDEAFVSFLKRNMPAFDFNVAASVDQLASAKLTLYYFHAITERIEGYYNTTRYRSALTASGGNCVFIVLHQRSADADPLSVRPSVRSGIFLDDPASTRAMSFDFYYLEGHFHSNKHNRAQLDALREVVRLVIA